MNKLIIIGLLLSLLFLSGCSSCNLQTRQQSMISILDYRDNHTRSECILYCDPQEFCDNIINSIDDPVNSWTEKDCLEFCR